MASRMRIDLVLKYSKMVIIIVISVESMPEDIVGSGGREVDRGQKSRSGKTNP